MRYSRISGPMSFHPACYRFVGVRPSYRFPSTVQINKTKGTICPHSLILNLLAVLTSFLLLASGSFMLVTKDLHADEGNVHCPKVNKIVLEGLKSMREEEFISLMEMGVGLPLFKKETARSVKRLFQKGIFEDIIVEVNRSVEGPCDIKIRVIERPLIDSISIEGNLFFSASTIKRQLSLMTNERLNTKKVQEALQRLQSFMIDSGFPQAKASYRIVQRDDLKVDLYIDISEGMPELIRAIKIEDSTGTLSRFLDLSEGEPFSLIELKKTEERLREYLKKSLYLQTELTYTFRDGLLSLALKKGRQIGLNIIGNEQLDRAVILKELPELEITSLSEELIDEFKKRIIKLYFSRGFPFVQVIAAVEETPEAIDLNFFIYEGSAYIVDEIKFHGTSVPEDKLKALLSLRKGSPYNPELVSSDIEALTEFFLSIGYSGVVVQSPEIVFGEGGVRVLFRIQEGEPQLIRAIDFQGNRAITNEALLKVIPLTLGAPINEIDLSESKRKILEQYRKLGFADAQVAIKREVSDGIQVTFMITENSPLIFGKTLFRGNRRTRLSALYRELLHKEGDLFQHPLLLKERQRLYRTGLFSDIDIDTSEPYQREGHGELYFRDVIFTVKEAPAGSLEFGIGYGEYEHLRGFVEVGYKNLWGMNRQGSLRTELSSLEQRLMVSYFDPWFFRENLPLKSILIYEKKTERSIDTGDVRYRLKRTIASLGIERRLTKDIALDLYYDFSVVNTYDVKPDIILSRDDTGTLIISALRTGLIYDTRDSPFDPKEGVIAGVSAKVASSLLLSETDFMKASFYFNKYYELTSGLVFALSVRGGVAKGFRQTQELPLVERFFLGGRTTVRGYEQDTLGPKGSDGNPTGGNLFAMTNLELRTNLGKGIGIVAFLDGGNVWQTTADLSGLKYTTGLGLRYNTPVGPLRVDYGYKLNRQAGQSMGELHFSLGHAF